MSTADVCDRIEEPALIKSSSLSQTFEYEQIFADLRPRLLQMARLRGVPVEALEDVVQETLLVAWRKLDHLYSPDGMELWLLAICRRVSARYLQAASKFSARMVPLYDRRLSGETGEVEDALIALGNSNESLDPAELLEREDVISLMSQALHLLPEQARQAVESYYLLDYSERETALRLGVSISALETRLHRARNRLRQILSTELRSQAAAADLPLAEEPAIDWPATALWCYYCGRQHLHAVFETSSDGRRSLRMRCPDCSSRFGFDIVNSKGLVEFNKVHSFQPAFKRTMREVSRQMLQALAAGTVTCSGCGALIPFQVGGPKQSIDWTPSDRLRRHFWLRGECPHCGYVSGGFSADDAVYWSHPDVLDFIRRYPRWLNELDSPLEYQGQPAILFRLSDHSSQAELHVLAHRQTLEVLDIFRQG
jgi:RNA polymerase sigma-70 factor (ECF subfamily)